MAFIPAWPAATSKSTSNVVRDRRSPPTLPTPPNRRHVRPAASRPLPGPPTTGLAPGIKRRPPSPNRSLPPPSSASPRRGRTCAIHGPSNARVRLPGRQCPWSARSCPSSQARPRGYRRAVHPRARRHCPRPPREVLAVGLGNDIDGPAGPGWSQIPGCAPCPTTRELAVRRPPSFDALSLRHEGPPSRECDCTIRVLREPRLPGTVVAHAALCRSDTPRQLLGGSASWDGDGVPSEIFEHKQ